LEETSIKREDEANPLDYLIVVLKHKRLVAVVTVLSAVVAVVVSLLIKPTYKAETQIFTPQSSPSVGLGMLMDASGGGLADMAGGALGLKSASELYVRMLTSRTVADKIIDRFGLMALYKEDHRVDARKRLLEDVAVVTGDKKSGVISVSVEDEDPKRAADMANAFVEELDNLTHGLAITEAAQRRFFFEDQLKETKASLAKAEEAMKAYQEKSGALDMDQQAKASIEGIATLRAQIAAKEVQLKVLRAYATPQNPELRRTEDVLSGLKTEIGKLEAKTGGGSDPIIPTGNMPGVGTEYMRRLRDLKFSETLYQLLAKQYEVAKLDEARDSVIIQTIDKAMPPDKKSKPKRGMIVVLATMAGFLLSVVFVIARENVESLAKAPEHAKRLAALKGYAGFRFKG